MIVVLIVLVSNNSVFFFSMCADKMQNLNEDDEKSSHFIFETAEDGNKTNAETTDTSGYKIEAKDLPDSWDSHAGKPTDSVSEASQTKGPLRTHLYEWDDEPEDSRTGEYVLDFDSEHLSEMKSKDEEGDKEDTENSKEAICEELVQTIPRPSNCRTYCRSNKAKQQGTTNFDKLMDGTSQSLSKANNESNNDGLNPAKKASLSSGTSYRGTVGRTRDYTVLHPSCLSVCNVTIQDTMERIDEFTTATPTDLGEAGRLRKKADIATTKTTTRFRPSNTKSKKDVKLEFFGFDDQDEGEGDEGASRSSGSSNYKIKYFGFDDLSESEDEDEEWQIAERKASKKRTRAAPSPSLQPTSDSNENCSQDNQVNTNTGKQSCSRILIKYLNSVDLSFLLFVMYFEEFVKCYPWLGNTEVTFAYFCCGLACCFVFVLKYALHLLAS